MTNEQNSDETAKANDEQIKDLAPTELSEEQVRGGESVSFNYNQIKWTYTTQDKSS